MEMDVQNGAEFVRRREPRKQVPGDPWRRGEDHVIVRAKLLLRPVEVERDGARVLETDGSKAIAEPDRRSPCGEKSKRRIDETVREPMAANSGRQAFPPAARVSRSKAAVSAAELSAGFVLSAEVSRGRQSRS